MRSASLKIPRWCVVVAMILLGVYACSKDDPTPGPACEPDPEPTPTNTSPVVFDLAQVPYDSLHTYNFFEGDMVQQMPVEGVLPYEPITPLFSDYAHKHRFVWMPDSVSATYNADHKVLDFPIGTVMIKTFYYDHVQPTDATKLIETRLIYLLDDGWHFANYHWNEDQTAATLNMDGGTVPIEWMDDNNITRSTNYIIPTEANCKTCHKVDDAPVPIGPKPQNLNKLFGYADGSFNQLQKWKDVGYLSGDVPANIETVVDWEDETQPLELRVRAYLDMNCSHCHANERHCDYRAPRFAWSETTNPDNLGICVEPDNPPIPQLTHIVNRGVVGRSVLHYRMNSTEETVRMPLVGRTVNHDEAILLVEQWINELNPPCN